MSALHKALTLLSLILLIPMGIANAKAYDHEIKDANMVFAWTINGDNLDIKISAQTTGWIAVGFNPSMRMKHANIIIGYVKDGEVVISDDYGFQETSHSADSKNGGTSDISNQSGTEINGRTTLEFTIPLQSKDKRDTAISTTGETTVILAYGSNGDTLYSYHGYRATKRVNLTTGEGSGDLDHSAHGGDHDR